MKRPTSVIVMERNTEIEFQRDSPSEQIRQFLNDQRDMDTATLKEKIMAIETPIGYIKDITDTYAKLIEPTVLRLSRQNCQGCEILHPSQTRHTCAMVPFKEHLFMYMSAALEEITAVEVCRLVRNRRCFGIPVGITVQSCEWLDAWDTITRAKTLLAYQQADDEIPGKYFEKCVLIIFTPRC